MLEEITEDTIGGFDQDFVTGMLTWFKNGGQSSLEELKKLSSEDRQSILEYLEKIELYEGIRCGMVYSAPAVLSSTPARQSKKANERPPRSGVSRFVVF